MSKPTFTGMTAIETNDLATDDAWGQNHNKWTSESSYAKEGTAANVTKFNVTGVGGGADNGVGGVNGNNNLFVGWVLIISAPTITDFANGGMRMNLSSSAASIRTDYKDWYIGGSDVPWCGRGWRCVALDATRTQDGSGGTFSITNVQSMGFGFNAAVTASQYPTFGIDMFYYGAGVEVTGPSLIDGSNGIDLNENGASADTIDRNDGGSFVTDGWEAGDYVKIVGSATTENDGEYEIKTVAASSLTLSVGDLTADDIANTSVRILCSVTFEDIYNWDNDETNNTNPMQGVVDKDPAGAYTVNYPLIIGDQSGSESIYFRSTGDNIVLVDQPLNETLVNYISLAEDTGKTYIQFGGEGLPGSNITGQDTIFATGSPRGLDLDVTVEEAYYSGITFSNIDGGITIASGSAHSYQSCIFVSCGEINLGDSAVFQNNTITTSIATSALTYVLVNTKTFTDLSFISAGTGHAIELTGTANDVTLDGVKFDGYATSDGSTGDECIYVNIATGSMTINVTNGDTPTIRTAGASVTVVVNPATLDVTVIDAETSSNISNARVFVKVADGTNFPYQDSVTITADGTTATVTHSSHGLSTGDKVEISGADQFQYNGVHTISGTGTNSYTYEMVSVPTTPASGTITSTLTLLDEVTDGTGYVSCTRSYGSDQPITGRVRKSSSSPYYKNSGIAGTVDKDNGLSLTIQMISDE